LHPHKYYLKAIDQVNEDALELGLGKKLNISRKVGYTCKNTSIVIANKLHMGAQDEVISLPRFFWKK
jgi:hypothetical protein